MQSYSLYTYPVPQVTYAALDAYYGRCVYDRLAQRGAFRHKTQVVWDMMGYDGISSGEQTTSD